MDITYSTEAGKTKSNKEHLKKGRKPRQESMMEQINKTARYKRVTDLIEGVKGILSG